MSPRRALALSLCLFAVAPACGDDGGPESLGGGNGGVAQDGGNAEQPEDGGSTGQAGNGGGNDAGGNATTGTGGSTSGGSGDDASVPDAGPDADTNPPPTRDPSTITGIRKPTVQCGDTECEGTTQVCCDTWTTDGWVDPTCVEKSECPTSAGPWASENLVRSECDGPPDCGTGNPDDPIVCCFILQSAPHYTADLLSPMRLPGPGFGRECLRRSACMFEGIEDAEPSEGMPRGLVSCTEDSHCEAIDSGLSCKPESMSDESAGELAPRPHVSLCK